MIYPIGCPAPSIAKALFFVLPGGKWDERMLMPVKVHRLFHIRWGLDGKHTCRGIRGFLTSQYTSNIEPRGFTYLNPFQEIPETE